MDIFSVLCILIGFLVIVGRGPLAFDPSRTFRAYRSFFMTNARVRAWGVVVALLAAALLLLPLGEGMLSDVLHVFGWIIAALALVTLLVPKILKGFALQIIDNLERALKAADEKSTPEDLREGVKLNLDLLLSKLKSIGIEPMEVLHQPFDPHQAG